MGTDFPRRSSRDGSGSPSRRPLSHRLTTGSPHGLVLASLPASLTPTDVDQPSNEHFETFAFQSHLVAADRIPNVLAGVGEQQKAPILTGRARWHGHGAPLGCPVLNTASRPLSPNVARRRRAFGRRRLGDCPTRPLTSLREGPSRTALVCRQNAARCEEVAAASRVESARQRLLAAAVQSPRLAEDAERMRAVAGQVHFAALSAWALGTNLAVAVYT